MGLSTREKNVILSDADLSLAEGELRAAVRQGKGSFVVEPEFFAHALTELRRYRSGELVPLPKSIQQAEAMHLIAERYIENNRTR